MHPDHTHLRIDPTPRRADGEYIAHVRISIHTADGRETELFASGDLAGFDLRLDAVAFARNWARDWLDLRLSVIATEH
jgi:hypothetical protein